MEPITNRTDSVPARQVPHVSQPAAASTPEESAPPSQISDLASLAEKAAVAGPDLRDDEIERGKRLVADPNYPNDDILEKLAEGLVRSEDFRAAL